MKENEKWYKNEQNDIIGAMAKREKLDINSVFQFEDWMIPIVEKNVIENFFHFDRAVRIIKAELNVYNFKNYELLTENDLRTKWTELELSKFRGKDETFFFDENRPLNVEYKENLENKIDETTNKKEIDKIADYNQNKIKERQEVKQKPVEIKSILEENEEMICTVDNSTNKDHKNKNIYDDLNNDDVIYMDKKTHINDTSLKNDEIANKRSTASFGELD